MAIKNWFKRKDDTVLDLSNLQKRGIIKAKKDSVIDFSSGNSSTSDGSSALGFLGSLAGSTDINTPIIISEGGKQKLRGFLRDMKLDMKNTTDKIYKILDRVDVIEKKLERLERRSGVTN